MDKGERFERDAILDVRTHFKPTETFQYTHFGSCHPQGVKKGFIKGEALRLLRTNSSKLIFEEKITNFKAHLLQRGYPEDLSLSEVNVKDRKLALQQKPKTNLRILPFVTIPTISAKPKANSHEKLAFNRTTTITERNLQKTAPRIL